ncbi:putative iron sulfur assembly protein [Thermochaetoides thermophila DSM 1495]|uniref:Iron-sulfur assembly protein 1 n=1 Tax=Chaetomium thermophilum (strain DSM 1495 / CBS 144.50 / IMI 039719) TaxID=759272 RepID=G0RYX9_CHATD|nr:putative iron sulfur assembly protein [Thermochaetoides thermophila DSM 1495]EGS23407.1 putative iron sulfur assembly protein [Thermochaetoides thermophila DSM 1495]
MNAPSVFSRRSASVCLACRRSMLHRQFSTSPASMVTAFQAYTLPSHPPPPRSGVTETITPIQTPLPRVHETRPPRGLGPELHQPKEIPTTAKQDTIAQSTAAQQHQSQFQSQSSSVSTEKTQTTASIQQSAPSTTQQQPSARPRSRLRTPRKAAMTLTPAAVAHLRELLNQPEPKLIKVGVRNRGCSGLAYHLEYVDKPGPFDELVEQDGVKVLIDSKALFSIIGSEMDWVENELSQRFVFRNPNIKEQCGCGESFMV